MAYAVVASWTVEPSAMDTVVEALRTARVETRQDPDCIHYEIHVSLEEPDRVLVYEVYKDEAAFQAHLRGNTVRRLSETLRGNIGQITRSPYRVL